MRCLFAIVGPIVLSGCFGPTLASIECGLDGLCPGGLVCDIPNDVCVAPGEVAVDAAPAPDAHADSDGDQVLDGDDNCPMVANAQQHDEDGDDVGDVCDNCPGHANADQADVGELGTGEADGVGDVCDPRPAAPGDEQLFFDGFNDESSLDSWVVVRGGSTWAIDGGKLIQSSSEPGFSGLVWKDNVLSEASIATRGAALALPPRSAPDDTVRSLGVIAQYDGTESAQGRGYLCTHYFDPAGGPNTTVLILAALLNLVDTLDETTAPPLTVGETFDIALDVNDGNQSCRSVLAAPLVVGDNDGRFDLGNVGLRTNGLSAEFDFAVVYGLGGSL